jgi:uncharacterized membrane protein
VNATTEEGNALFRATRAALNIESGGVPQLIIGNTVLLGSADIPEYAPQIIRDGLANGGIGMPAIPGIAEAFAAQLGTVPVATQQTFVEKFANDPIGNGAAVVVLVILGISIGNIGLAFLNPQQAPKQAGWYALIVLLMIGFALMISILIKSDQMETTLIAIAVGIMLLVTLGVQSERQKLVELPVWIVPMLMIGGLLVAGYLSYIEVSATEAVCGAIGDCNTVQQSEYASIAGIPVGVLGIAGYLVMLALWVAGRWLKIALANTVLILVVVGAAAFSIYLTFLEPFVIGATCAWCLTSAVIVGMLVWLIIPPFLEQKFPQVASN